MDILEIIKTSLQDTLTDVIGGVTDSLPSVLKAIVILLVGWLLAKIISKVIVKALKAIKFDDLIAKVKLDEMLNKIKPGISLTEVLGKLIYYFLLLAFVNSTAKTLGWDMVTSGIAGFFDFLPKLLMAMVIFVLGTLVAKMIKNLVYTACNSIGISGAKAIGNIVYYIILIMVVVVVLEKLEINTDPINDNLSIILGAILLAFAISYGIAARSLVANMVSSYYGKGKFSEGQVVKVDGIQGTITKIDSISVTLQTKDSDMVIPSRRFIEENVEILKTGNSNPSLSTEG